MSASGTQFGLIVNSDGTINTGEITYSKKLDNNSFGQPDYIGLCSVGAGSNVSGAVWQIQKMEYDDGDSSPPTGQLWASGNTIFDKKWNLRTGYPYR